MSQMTGLTRCYFDTFNFICRPNEIAGENKSPVQRRCKCREGDLLFGYTSALIMRRRGTLIMQARVAQRKGRGLVGPRDRRLD